MKNMISDKKTVPVPGRGERIDGGRTLRGKKIVFTAVCVALAAVLCCAGVIGAPAEVEGLALQEKVTPVRLKETAETVLKKAIVEDTLKEAVDKVASKEANAKDTLKEAAIQYDAWEKEEPREPQQENEQSKISSQQEDQQETENNSVETDEEKRTIEETAEENEAEENEALGKAEIPESIEEVARKGKSAEEDYHQNLEQQDAYAEGDADVSDEAQADDDLLQTPVEGFTVSSPFGPRWGRLHTGIDLALAQGNPIYAADSGTVIFSGYSGGYGNLVKIDHGNGMQTNYAHCSQILVSQGQQVERGEEIALVGSTGNSTGPHLHFEVVIDGSCVNPANHLDLE